MKAIRFHNPLFLQVVVQSLVELSNRFEHQNFTLKLKRGLTDELIADSQSYKQFVKHAIANPEQSTCEVRMPVLTNGSLEHFLKFLILFKQAMADMNLDTKISVTFREFRDHAIGRDLSRFNSSYDDHVANVPDAGNLTPENLEIMIASTIVGFGRTNRLKCIKRHMSTISKPFGVFQDEFMKRMCAMQSYLQLLNHYFDTITPLTNDEFKDSFVQAQLWKFKANFSRSCMLVDLCTTEELSEYFDEVQ